MISSRRRRGKLSRWQREIATSAKKPKIETVCVQYVADFTVGNVCGCIELEQSLFLPEVILMIACDSFIVFRAFMEYFSEN